MKARELTHAETIAEYLNTFGYDHTTFNFAMSKQHRTLQQCFTRLCLRWLEFCASDDFTTDGRNERSKEIAKEIFRFIEESDMDTSLPMI